MLGPIGRELAKRHYHRDFWALRDVTFAVERGEAFGVMGRNGAGKSTLLQIIAGTLTPTAGAIVVGGRVGALLELGSGFAPDFTGRENVRLSASLLGLTARQIDERFDEIEAFADIGDFIDQPIKTYSSGMVLRLAFAVQTAVQPEILIVDEALAVGDARFQNKCFSRLEQMRKTGTTILLVTHDSGTIVQLCTRAMILDGGRVVRHGDPLSMTREYHKLLFDTPAKPAATSAPTSQTTKQSGASSTIAVASPIEASPAKQDRAHQTSTGASREVRYGTVEGTIVALGLRDPHGNATTVVETHTLCEAYFQVVFPSPIADPIAYGFIISNAKGVEVYGTRSRLFHTSIQAREPNSAFECRLQFIVRLVPGRYFLTAAIAHDDERADGQFLDVRFDAFEFQVMGGTRSFTTSLVDLDAQLNHVLLRTYVQR